MIRPDRALQRSVILIALAARGRGVAGLCCSSQVVLEVHDIDGRLSSVVDMLRSEAAGFEHVCWEAQETSEVGGYVMVLPRALRMFLVFARRVAKAGGDCGRCAENYGSGIGPREGAGGRDGVGDQPDAMRSSSCCCHRSPTL